jgi:hypothetical protein
MNDQADNPYAAPKAPPEEQPPVPSSAYLRAAVAGTTAFVVGFGGAAAFSVMVFVLLSKWYGPPIAEREEIARRGVLACCILIGMLLGAVATRRTFRQRTIGPK